MDELGQKIKGKGFFKVGNIFIDDYAKIVGYSSAIVYLCIKRFEYLNTRIAFPSEEVIAEKLDMSPRTVIRKIKILETHNLIKKQKTKHKGKWYHNTYFLTQSSEWLPKIINQEQSTYVTNNTSLCDKNDNNQVTQSHTKKTNNKKTNIKKEVLLKEQERGIKNAEESKDVISLKDYLIDNKPEYLKGRGNFASVEPHLNEK